MEGFSYVDIFDTKGIEYLIVIGFLLLIIPVWILLNRKVKVREELIKSVEGINKSILSFPRGLTFAKNHTWSYLEKNGLAKIGLDDLLLHITGGVSVDYLRSEGQEITKGEVIALISNGERKLQIKSPLSGKISRINKDLLETEGSINADPYGKSWLTRIEPADWRKETKDYMMAEDAENWRDEELTRCKDFLANVAGEEKGTVVVQEGGALADFPLAEMPEEIWRRFQAEFLD